MSDELTPEEIADVEASEKEFAEGKCKTFETVEELLADLKQDIYVYIDTYPIAEYLQEGAKQYGQNRKKIQHKHK